VVLDPRSRLDTDLDSRREEEKDGAASDNRGDGDDIQSEAFSVKSFFTRSTSQAGTVVSSEAWTCGRRGRPSWTTTGCRLGCSGMIRGGAPGMHARAELAQATEWFVRGRSRRTLLGFGWVGEKGIGVRAEGKIKRRLFLQNGRSTVFSDRRE
jgi:hypothetical protein